MRNLYRFSQDAGRMGRVDGLFVASEEEVARLIGREVYFGEILGKHSEVTIDFEEGDIEKIELDSETVEKVTELLGETWSGYNPFDYIDEDEEDGDDEDEDSDLDEDVDGDDE